MVFVQRYQYHIPKFSSEMLSVSSPAVFDMSFHLISFSIDFFTQFDFRLIVKGSNRSWATTKYKTLVNNSFIYID